MITENMGELTTKAGDAFCAEVTTNTGCTPSDNERLAFELGFVKGFLASNRMLAKVLARIKEPTCPQE